MNKTLTINIYQDPTAHIEQFLEDWQKFGNHQQNSDFSYQLISNGNTSQLTMEHDKVTIQGHIPSETFMIIDKLAKACEADKVVEGEVIDDKDFAHQTFSQGFGQGTNKASFQSMFGANGMPKITTLSKTKLILLLILAIPILIITIPVIIVVAIVKIILFKLKLK